MSKLFDELKDIIGGAEEDVDKFYNKGNKAAGTRIRKAMQELKKVAQDLRTEVQDKKKDL